jgi:transcription initiation factor TFIIB
MPVDDSINYVSKIASNAKLSQKTENLATELLQKAKQRKEVVGKGPMGIAATALYIASKINIEKITQKEPANAAGVTEVTVRNRFRGLDTSLGLGLRKMLRG